MGSRITALRYARRVGKREAVALTGSPDARLAREAMRQLIEALGLSEGLSRRAYAERVAAAKAALAGLLPLGTLEGMMGIQMIATHNAAMACLSRAMDEKTDDATAQGALRRAERLLAVYARQSDSLLRLRQAKPRAAAAADDIIDGSAFVAPPWMQMLAGEARAWMIGQMRAERLGNAAPEPKQIEATAL